MPPPTRRLGPRVAALRGAARSASAATGAANPWLASYQDAVLDALQQQQGGARGDPDAERAPVLPLAPAAGPNVTPPQTNGLTETQTEQIEDILNKLKLLKIRVTDNENDMAANETRLNQVQEDLNTLLNGTVNT